MPLFREGEDRAKIMQPLDGTRTPCARYGMSGALLGGRRTRLARLQSIVRIMPPRKEGRKEKALESV